MGILVLARLLLDGLPDGLGHALCLRLFRGLLRRGILVGCSLRLDGLVRSFSLLASRLPDGLSALQWFLPLWTHRGLAGSLCGLRGPHDLQLDGLSHQRLLCFLVVAHQRSVLSAILSLALRLRGLRSCSSAVGTITLLLTSR